MRKIIAAIIMIFAWGLPAVAKGYDKPSQGDVYVFVGPLVSNTRYEVNPAYIGVIFQPGQPVPSDFNFKQHGGGSFGFGGEAFVYKGLGVGPEIGYSGEGWKFDGDGIGVGSVDASYHFCHARIHRKLDPFMVGGYSLYFGDRTASQSGFNFGGGVNYWFSKHVALRLEAREQDHIKYFHSQFVRLVEFRIGLTLR